MGHITNYYQATGQVAQMSDYFRRHLKGKYSSASSAEKIAKAKFIAGEIIKLIPPDLDCVLPRGYYVQNACLVLCRQSDTSQNPVMYQNHPNWTEEESAVFLVDLEDGWIAELILFLKWQYRKEDNVFESVQLQIRKLGEMLP